jgi:hypothetical protein
VPPVIETLVVVLVVVVLREEDGPGVEVRETGLDLGLDLGTPRSDTSVPMAEGGGFEGCCGGGVADLAGAKLLRWALLLDGVDAPDRPDM